jgi:hypothetical protein
MPKGRPSVEVDPTTRDFVMARLLAARASAQAAIDAIDDATLLFVEPEDDEKGKKRRKLLEAALDASGAASRALECADEAMPEVDFVECEPWDEDGDEDEDEEDDDGDDD